MCTVASAALHAALPCVTPLLTPRGGNDCAQELKRSQSKLALREQKLKQVMRELDIQRGVVSLIDKRADPSTVEEDTVGAVRRRR